LVNVENGCKNREIWTEGKGAFAERRENCGEKGIPTGEKEVG
jgi:hypothetical protein